MGLRRQRIASLRIAQFGNCPDISRMQLRNLNRLGALEDVELIQLLLAVLIHIVQHIVILDDA